MIKFSDFLQLPDIKVSENVVKANNVFRVTLTYDIPLDMIKEQVEKSEEVRLFFNRFINVRQEYNTDGK